MNRLSCRMLAMLTFSTLCIGCDTQQKEPSAKVVAGGSSTDVDSPASNITSPVPKGAVADLPTLEAEQKSKLEREIEQYKKQTGFTQIDSNKGPESLAFMKGGFTQTPDGTSSIGAAGVGATLKDAHDAAIIAAQREMMKNGSIAAAKVHITQGAFRKLADGWQVFVQGQAGPGAAKSTAKDAKDTKPAPIDLPEK